MTQIRETEQALLLDFLEQLADDRRRGELKPLAAYLERFATCEHAVALEYLRFVGALGVAPATRTPSADAHTSRERYDVGAEIARGGMGSVHVARDRQLEREVALKRLTRAGRRERSTFLQEAQVTGQLDHPGIVPVHELGEDADGRPWFTMRRVHGVDLREVLAHHRRGAREWPLAAVLRVLVRVCETLAYAHQKGVVHRDVKPSNVMVGEFGEVYVVDWGLAHVLSRAGDVASAAPRDIHSVRAELRADEPLSPLATRAGDVLGTPSYMAPEQAAGAALAVTPAVDVYAVGAILYQALTGEAPYADDGWSDHDAVLERVRAGPPRPVHEVARGTPAELVAVCEKAMARESAERYASMRALAADLQAYLDVRVVGAYRTGAWVELAKWVRRNRAFATTAAALIVLAVTGASVLVALHERSQRNQVLLADTARASELVGRARLLWPAVPEQIDALRAWLVECRPLLARRAERESELAAVRAQALPVDPCHPAELHAQWELRRRVDELRDFGAYYAHELERLEREGGLSDEGLTALEVNGHRRGFVERAARLEAEFDDTRRTWRLPDPELQARHDALSGLVDELASLGGTGGEHGDDGFARVLERRFEYALSIEAVTLDAPARAWADAIASIRDRSVCPQYDGLVLAPQLGLVPIGRDPHSGLWEFAHLETGAPPVRAPDGSVVLASDSALVLVLLPGARTWQGAQASDPRAQNYDARARSDEGQAQPGGERLVVRCVLDPFFVSKYEMTQAQWRRASGTSPSAGATAGGLAPVEHVSWFEAESAVRALGLALPSEAQWEYAARGGTTTPWSTGASCASLDGNANLGIHGGADDLAASDDGFPAAAPVGRFAPNAFGLHDMLGNVAEWCRDIGGFGYETGVTLRVGERRIWEDGTRACRGGHYGSTCTDARCAARGARGPQVRLPTIGVRPARDIVRGS